VLFRATNPPPATSAVPAGHCPDRRSPSRLRIAEGWRKTIAPATESDIDPSTKARVAVWVASTASVLRAESALKLLTPCDRAAFALLSRASAREAAAARVLLRLSLSLAFGRQKAPHEWQFEKTRLGKPFVAGVPSPISFTLAHTDTLIAVAVSTSVDVGIDVETIDQSISDDLICDTCTVTEKGHLLSLPQTQRRRQFIQLWTQKEAYSKLVGCGLSREFSSMNLPLPANDRAADTGPKTCHLEGFFIPANNSLHYGSLAVANDGREPIDVSVFDVSGPDNANRSGVSLPLL
jgi:phosphopantetheinyl transferase